MPNHTCKHYLFWWVVLRGVIWHLFFWRAKVKSCLRLRLSHLYFLQVRTKTCLPSIWLFPKRPSPREIEIVGFSTVAQKDIGWITSAFVDLNFTIFTTFNIVYCLPSSQLSTRMYEGLIVGWNQI